MKTKNDIFYELTNYIYRYERINYDSRDMTFSIDGKIAKGMDGLEQFWELVYENDIYFLIIKGSLGQTCKLKYNNGDWVGSWDICEKMGIKLSPLSILTNPIKKTIYPWIFDTQFNKEDFSIIIQGPLNIISILNLPNYLSFAKNIIISHWDYDKNQELLDPYRNHPCIKIVKSKPHPERQIWTTLQGLKLVNTKFSIKTRSDERYANLAPLINKILLFPNKFISNNILFLKKHFHPSDHLFGSRTDLLKRMCEIIIDKTYPINLELGYCTETIIGLSFLTALNCDISIKDHDDILKKNFDVVPVSELGNHIWSCNQRGIHSSSDNININEMLTWGYSIDSLDFL